MFNVPYCTNDSQSFKLDFPCSNNEAEYEALLIGLKSTLLMGIQRLCVQRDSRLTIK